eukprot:scaffold34601_cov234-Amphora_coffeaeformis.AAC.4
MEKDESIADSTSPVHRQVKGDAIGSPDIGTNLPKLLDENVIDPKAGTSPVNALTPRGSSP